MLDPVLGSAVDTWATVFVAIGTVGTVVYALFRDLIVIPRRRPKLDLRFDRGGTDQIVVATGAGADAAYVRLRVANQAGKETADDVVVMVTEIRPTATSESQPIGLPLTWSGTTPPRTVASVHPASERHIDLLHVDRPTGDESDIARKRTGEVSIHLDLTPRPAGGRDTLAPGAYEMFVEVRARNADALRYAIDVDWDGRWSGTAAVWEHLRIETPRKLR